VPHNTNAAERDDGIVHELKKKVDALAHSGLKPDVILARLKAEAGKDETQKKSLPTLQQVCVRYHHRKR
jgi:predicted RecB family endonuclease